MGRWQRLSGRPRRAAAFKRYKSPVPYLAPRYFPGGPTNEDDFFAAAAAVALTAIAPALAQTAQAPLAPRVGKAMTQAEVAQKVQRRFVRLDANRDGFITQAEVQAGAAQRPMRQRQGAGMRGQHRNPGAMFDRLDTDRNGQISRAEFDAMHAQRGQRMKMMGAMRGHGRGFGGHMFAMADLNKDGRVSLQEATAASLQHFNAADANRDGSVTPDERRQMRMQMRAAPAAR